MTRADETIQYILSKDPEWVEPWKRKEVEGKEISGSNDPPPDLESVKGVSSNYQYRFY